jgi:putative inorganic carbon (HCO3(-)) transporter
MGFILTLIYVFLTIVSPDQFGEKVADYHLLAYLAGAAFLFSVPEIINRRHLLYSVQTYLLLGFTVAIALSKVANGWYGGAIVAWKIFLPCVGVFFFIVANVTTPRRLKILALTIVGSSLVVVIEALCGYYFGFRGEAFVLTQGLFVHDEFAGQFNRLRGAGYLSDPNDFAQVLLIALPLLFLAWRRGKDALNSALVLAPAAVLLWAIYLTHSRGALVGLAVLAVMLIRKRIGTTGSLVLTSASFVGLLALNFTGGRLISASAGADRLWIWASGLQMFKHAPVFGVGFGNFTEFYEVTAHNSFVLCLAELGLVGSLIWVALLVTTFMGLNRIIKRQAKSRQQPSSPELAPLPKHFYQPMRLKAHSVLSKTFRTLKVPIPNFRNTPDFCVLYPVPLQWVLAVRLALLSFVTTSWFLSRAYQTPMYLILGLATATILLQQNKAKARIRISWIFLTLAVEASTIALIYEIVRLRF